MTLPTTSADVPFSVGDEASCHFDEPGAANTVQFEVRVRGELDQGRLRDAVHEAVASHPRYSYRRRPPGRMARGYFWQPTDTLDTEPFSTGEAKNGDALALERAALYGSAPSVSTAPALRIRHLTTPDGDRVLFCAHHALLDGRSLVDFVRTVVANYAGTPVRGDRPAAVSTPITVESASSVPSAPDYPVPATRPRAFARPLHLTRRGGTAPGYGFDHTAMEAGVLRPAELRGTATVNDIVVTAAALALARWNPARAARRPIRVTVPFSDPGTGPGNHSSLGNIEFAGRALDDAAELRAVVADVRAQIAARRRETERQLGAIGPVFASGLVPVLLKAALARTAARRAGAWQSSVVVSNLGQVPTLSFGRGEDLVADRVVFSAPARMPRGIFLGVAGHRGVVHLTLRYNTALFDAGAAADFMVLLEGALADVTESLLAKRLSPASG